MTSTIRYLQNYEIVGVLPNGANGICYRVRADGREYFAKQLLRPKGVSTNAGMTRKQIRRKTEIIARFTHREKQLATILETPRRGAGNVILPVARFWHGTHYVKVFPFVHGATGHEDVSLSEAGTHMLIRSLCVGLASLHEAGVAHGDLKPENVIARKVPAADGSDGAVASIIDLEDCYLLADPPEPRRIGGDEAFMSPELERYRWGEPVDFDGAASEVYALGLVIHMLLAGKLPRRGRVRRIVDDDVRDVIPRPAYEAVQAALLFDPGGRPTAYECFESFAAGGAPEIGGSPSETADVLRGTMGRGADRRVIVHMGRRGGESKLREAE